MTKIEALELELKCRKMVEGTNLDWGQCVRRAWVPTDEVPFPFFRYGEPDLTRSVTEYTIALGIVEGKPVWEGDVLYCSDGGTLIVNKNTPLYKKDGRMLSWNPPKLKTVMVELPTERVHIKSETSWLAERSSPVIYLGYENSLTQNVYAARRFPTRELAWDWLNDSMNCYRYDDWRVLDHIFYV